MIMTTDMKAKKEKQCWYLAMTVSLIICHLSFCPTTAQTFTQRLQQKVKGEGVVTIYQDKAIDELVNGPQPVMPISTAKANDKKSTTTKPAKKQDNKKNSEKPAANRTQQADTATTSQPQANDSISRPRRSYRTTGYRVQVFAGGNSRNDRQRAERTGNRLRTLFPEHQVYVHFYSPRWICRIGNFKTYEEADKLRDELKEMGFGTTTIVKGKVTLQY